MQGEDVSGLRFRSLFPGTWAGFPVHKAFNHATGPAWNDSICEPASKIWGNLVIVWKYMKSTQHSSSRFINKLWNGNSSLHH
jgi:hypothetical protein